MLKIFLNAFGLDRDADKAAPSWWHDPLSHPDIARMDQRQIADLPMPKLAAPVYPACNRVQTNVPSRGGSASTSKCSGGNPARARDAIC
jgi:hypothetical protein